MKIDKTTKIQIVILAFLMVIVAAMYLNTLETRSIPYEESYQEPVYRTEYYQDPVYRTDIRQEPVYRTVYFTEKVPYTDTVSNSRSISYHVDPGVCDSNGRKWLGLRHRDAISQFEVINTDTIGGTFTLWVGMILEGGPRIGQEITKSIPAGGYAFFEYTLNTDDNVTCVYNLVSALSTTTDTVTKYNDVQKSKQIIDRYDTKSDQVLDRYETKSKQVFDHYDTKYVTKYESVTKTKYLWLVDS